MLRTQSGIQVEKWESKCPPKNKPDDHSACANKGSILNSHKRVDARPLERIKDWTPESGGNRAWRD